VIVAGRSYNIAESSDGGANCSVQSVVTCRSLVSQSPNLTADIIDLLCGYEQQRSCLIYFVHQYLFATQAAEQ